MQLRKLIGGMVVGFGLCWGISLRPGWAGDAAMALQEAHQAQAAMDILMEEMAVARADFRRLQMEAEVLVYENRILDERLDVQEKKRKQRKAVGGDTLRFTRHVEWVMGELAERMGLRMDFLPPFRMESRIERLDAFRSMLVNAEKSTEERFYAALDLLEAELNVGIFPDVVSGSMEQEGEVVRGSLLHLGAAGLFFLSPDERRAARWCADKKTFLMLDRSEARLVSQAFAMVERRMPAEVVLLPVMSEVP
ncbi:DUF3450 domain-containing protein [Desulfobotulus sp. H1]|uniref:DUF3450 domain-containing protein n=1 Tax=Desulfobotulus pelophilus TaxID=2823377 RepID=A0ABT3N4W2_9BACT|nr:DUF3450 family protein [Desulfobotulus pelophilus]MCW7752498.1 DUF3450 domain-containing protein [Desulfobotulus pelophilus]